MKRFFGNCLAHTSLCNGLLALCVGAFLCGCAGKNPKLAPDTDDLAPTAPANLTATVVSGTQINLSWTASTDNVGVAAYKLDRCQGAGCSNFAQIAAPTTTSFSDTNPGSANSLSYRVQATDADDNVSGFSNTATVNLNAPSTDVGVTLSPTRGGLTVSQAMVFTATVSNDSGNQGVTWSASAGAFSKQNNNSATFVAPSAAGVVSITATSIADVTKSASATIGVTDLSGVTTYHNDLARDGANTQEYALTAASVTSSTFGKLFACPIDGPAYAQPLWMANLSVGGGIHNVFLTATVHDSVYAFDADATPCVTYWHDQLLPAGETWVASTDVALGGDISPDVGIIGTPVIDPTSNTLYVVTKSKNAGTACVPSAACHQRLHALKLSDGSEQFNGPVDITASITVPGSGDGASAGLVPFNPLTENQRPGLALVNGVVYVCWASHEDNDPYHGWVMGFTVVNGTLGLAPNAVFNATPNSVAGFAQSRGGIWMSGGAPAADSNGNLYLLTGNGSFDANTGGSNYGDSTVKLATAGGLSLMDWFTPADQFMLFGHDTDHGSGGAAILLDQPGGPHPHLMIGGGKEGNLFLLDRDNMGHYNNTNQVVQTLDFGNAIFATAAFWQNTLYLAGFNGPLKAYPFSTATGMFSTSSSSRSGTSYAKFGATPSVSANGATNGIIWALDNSLYCTAQSPGCGPTVLHAYDATNLATELWNSSQGSGNAAGNAVKFMVPTVANGKVYVGTRTEVTVYGLLPN